MDYEAKAKYTQRMLTAGNWRIVRNKRREKVLRSRGEGIAWNSCVNAWVWDWQYRVNRVREKVG